LVVIFIYDHNFTISYDDLMMKFRQSYDEFVTILWSSYDFSKIGPQVLHQPVRTCALQFGWHFTWTIITWITFQLWNQFLWCTPSSIQMMTTC